MLTRFSKSVVKNAGQRKSYAGEKKLTLTIFGISRDIGKTLSGFVNYGPKMDFTLVNPSKPKSSRLLMLTAEKSRCTNPTKSETYPDLRIDNLPIKHQSMKNRIIPNFSNRELDVERTLIELRDKELKHSMRNCTRNKTKTSDQRSITSFPLSEARVTGLMGVLSRLPAIASESTASHNRQLGQTKSDKVHHTPITTQLMNLDTGISSYPKPKKTSEEIHTTIRKLVIDTPSRISNDDYYPQGDEYEDQSGIGEHGQSMPESRKSTNKRKKTQAVDEDYDNFSADLLFSADTLPNPINREFKFRDLENMVLAKNISDGNNLEKLQDLIDKVAEFKKRIFGLPPHKKETRPKVEVKTENKNNDSNSDQSRNSGEDRMVSSV